VGQLSRLIGVALLALGILPAAQAWAQGQGANIPARPMPDTETGIFRNQIVRYALVDHRPVLEGDILLDNVRPAAPFSRIQPNGLGTADKNSLWPKVAGVFIVPYVITGGDTANINTAISQFNVIFKGFIRFALRNGQANYVNFNLAAPPGGSCYSYIGDIHNGGQEVNGSTGCTVAAILHEMGHALGLYHEQSRYDRDSYITFNLNNVIDGEEYAFAQPVGNGQDLGSYDYASIMHYYARAFSRNGLTTMESKPAGIEFGEGTTYSPGDIDAIKRIYGAAPRTVTIATLPLGLTVQVDGVSYKTPKTFSWALNSTHTLAVAPGAQTLNGQAYTFGRWSDAAGVSHSITVKPGSGTPATPKAAPALTVYLASFIHLVPFNPMVSIIGEGTVTATPAAKTYAGVTGKFFPTRLPVTYTATPATGYVFAGWGAQSPSGRNPLAGFSDDYVFAYVAPSGSPLTTIATSPAGLPIGIDGALAGGPSLFAWSVGSGHTLGPAPYSMSPNTNNVVLGWSDKGAITHNVTASGASQTITATVKQQFKPSLVASPTCAATLKLTPASVSGFYDSGTTVQAAWAAKAGWKFAGWTWDLAGSGSPVNVVMNSEKRATALFNTVAAPLKITAFSPAGLTAGSPVRTLALLGTGFSSGSAVFVNGSYRPPTVASSTRLTIPLTAADVAGPSALDIQLVNSDSTSSCQTYDGKVFFVTGS
jgi:astacin